MCDDFIKRNVPNRVFKDTSQNPDYIAKYYEKKDNVNFLLTNETKFMSVFFWRRVHL